MFFITKRVTNLPGQLLYFIGTPFHWKPESSLVNLSEEYIKREYKGKQFEH